MATTEGDQTRQILKARDDRAPLVLERDESWSEEEQVYRAADGSSSSWLEGVIRPEGLRSRVEPWLSALFQSDHLALLVGSGLTTALHTLATDTAPGGMEKVSFKSHAEQIEAEVLRTAGILGRGEGNVEDQVRVANALLRGLSILATTDDSFGAPRDELAAELETVLTGLAESVLAAERGLRSADGEKAERAFNYLVSFLMSFASRTGTRDRLHIFSTNYDRVIEAGADLAGIHLLDRFVGSLTPILRASRLDVDMHYNPPGIRGEPRYLEGVARFTKLHGSVDWIDAGRVVRRMAVPLGASDIAPYLSGHEAGAVGGSLMIYPNAAKDQETTEFPYVELFRDFAAAVCRPNSTLVTYGYGFGDEHINRVIEDMLTIPSTHLVIISYSDPLGRITQIYDRVGRPAQVSLLVGDHFGELTSLVDYYLPKPGIDRTTFRMADLLKSRWSSTTAVGDVPPVDEEASET